MGSNDMVVIKEKETKTLQWQYALLAIFVTMVLSVIIFGVNNRLPGQTQSFLLGDQREQFVETNRMFWNSILDKDKSLEMSFEYSMGFNSLGQYAYIAMSPLCILYAFIENDQLASWLVWSGKTMLAAFFFWYYAVTVLQCKEKTAGYFAVAYALSSYMVADYVNIQFLDAVYIAPLLFTFLYDFVKNGKLGKLTLVYAFSFVNMFFTGYSLGIFSFIVYLCLLGYCGKNKKECFNSIGRYLSCVLTAILLSMVIILPAVAMVVQHMPSGSSFSQTEYMKLWEFPVAFLAGRKNYTIFTRLPFAYCGWPAMLLTILFFADRRNGNRVKLLAGLPLFFLVLCFFCKPLCRMMHMFDDPDSFPFRFSFLLIFALMTIAIWQYERICKQDIKKSVRWFSFIGILLCYMVLFLLKSFVFREMEFETPFLLGINLALVTVYILTVRGRAKPLFLVLGYVEIVWSGICGMLPTDATQEDYFRWLERGRTAVALAEEENAGESLFYRIQYPWAMQTNGGMIFPFHGIGYFTSFEYTALREELFRLGYYSRAQLLYDDGGTEFTRMIFSQKYTADTGEWYYEDTEPVSLTKNECCLPLAFMVCDGIRTYQATSTDPYENQNILAQTMCGDSITLFSDGMGLLNILNVRMGISYDENGIWFYRDNIAEGDEGAGMEFSLCGEAPAYLYFQRDVAGNALWSEYGCMVAPGTLEHPKQGLPMSSCYSIPMALTESGRTAALWLNDNNAYGFCQTVYCGVLDQEALEQVYQNLSGGGLDITSFQSTKICGKICAETGKSVLFTSIPYDAGWHIYVDGAESESFAVMDGAFLAAYVPEGEHDIEICYRDNSLLMGIICSLCGAGIWICLCLADMRRKSA